MTATKQRLTDAMKAAMIGGQKERLGVIRMLLTEVKNAEINHPTNPRQERSEEEVLATIGAYHKSLSKTMAEYPPERQGKIKDELVIIEEFLPKQMTLDEVKSEIKSDLAQTEERNFGSLMKVMSAKFKGRADGKSVSDALKQALTEV